MNAPAPRRPDWAIIAGAGLFALVVGVLVWEEFATSTAAPAVPYERTIRALGRAKPGQITYDRVRTISTGLRKVFSLTVTPDGQVLVAGDTQVMAFDAEGRRLRAVPVGGPARCVAVHPDGRWFIGMADHVEIYSPEGTRLSAWKPFSSRSNLTALALAGDELYVADGSMTLAGIIRRCAIADGHEINRIGEPDPQRRQEGLKMPSNTESQNEEREERPFLDVTWDGTGLLVTNPGALKVEQYSPEGRRQFGFGESGLEIERFCGCCNPIAVAPLGDGRVVTAEKGEGFARVKIFDGRGDLLTVVADAGVLGDHKYAAIDVATDAGGRIHVLDGGGRCVHVFAPREESGPSPATTAASSASGVRP